MYKKKYGKVTVNAWLNLELEASRPSVMLIGGFLMLMAGVMVRFFVGTPYMTLLSLGVDTVVPPVWLMTFLWSLSFLIIGCSGGFVLGYRNHHCDVDKYKGCMLFVLLAVMELCWYPVFFGAGLLFLSVLLSILILCFSVATTLCFCRVSRFAGILFVLHDIWLVYMLILNFAVFFTA